MNEIPSPGELRDPEHHEADQASLKKLMGSAATFCQNNGEITVYGGGQITHKHGFTPVELGAAGFHHQAGGYAEYDPLPEGYDQELTIRLDRRDEQLVCSLYIYLRQKNGRYSTEVEEIYTDPVTGNRAGYDRQRAIHEIEQLIISDIMHDDLFGRQPLTQALCDDVLRLFPASMSGLPNDQ